MYEEINVSLWPSACKFDLQFYSGDFMSDQTINYLMSIENMLDPYVLGICCFNTLRPGQNGRHFVDKISLNKNVWISIDILSPMPHFFKWLRARH